ncbi:Gti1/Pac2 family-domain-containing protein [Mycena maculata]|uniref:Gti1/Pac2 family-domain-containing protein n=1 Tax=Mycena maculata TaxID=230809 RepID=A0AAD7KBN5_9AGAR|nr:Gti1/Pac2 family-domain-containing protein [Mycena maculata]
MPMQRPTCTGMRVRSPADAHVIFHGVSLGILPMITRRLDTEERRAISSGCVFVWEERGGPNTEPMGLGIERWTDSIRWGPSRVREEFLFYHEKDPDPIDIDLGYDSDAPSPLGYGPSHVLLRENLIKQTYSVFVETTHGRRKWHLIAYFTQDSVDYLRSVDDIPYLACLRVPPGIYTSARSAKGTGRTRFAEQHFPYGRETNTRPYPAPPPYSPPTVVIRNVRVKEILAPLEYLENIPPPRRHPEDEKALMSFPFQD